jgi:hypothetical protein
MERGGDDGPADRIERVLPDARVGEDIGVIENSRGHNPIPPLTVSMGSLNEIARILTKGKSVTSTSTTKRKYLMLSKIISLVLAFIRSS